MELKHVIAKNESDKSVTMLLYGGIGSKIDGDYFARELEYLSANFDEITIRINSEGGSVFQGLSIIDAMMSSKAYIIAHITGVAASMAAAIPMAADKVIMNDFARMMVHNPSYSGSKNLTPKEKKALESIRTMLVSVMTTRGVDEATMVKMMNEETWMTAEEAKGYGLIDEIITTGKREKVEATITSIAASAEQFNEFLDITHIKNENKMEVIAQALGKETVTEAEVVAQIQSLQSENETLKADKTALEAKITAFEAEKEAALKAEAAELVANAIKDGFYKEEQKDQILAIAENSLDAFKVLVSGLQKPKRSISDEIDTTPAEGQEDDDEVEARKSWTYDDYRKKDPQAFAAMSEEKQQELIDAYVEKI